MGPAGVDPSDPFGDAGLAFKEGDTGELLFVSTLQCKSSFSCERVEVRKALIMLAAHQGG